MKKAIFFVALLAVGCTTMQVTTPASILVPAGGPGLDAVFVAALQSCQEAGLIVQSSDKSTGYLYATKATNPLTTNAGSTLSLSVTIAEGSAGVAVNVAAVLGGQMVSYGATEKAAGDFCRAFQAKVPTAQITLNGKALGAAGEPAPARFR